jgi:hypothetical protein
VQLVIIVADGDVSGDVVGGCSADSVGHAIEHQELGQRERNSTAYVRVKEGR